jgi:hypothetical protein
MPCTNANSLIRIASSMPWFCDASDVTAEHSQRCRMWLNGTYRITRKRREHKALMLSQPGGNQGGSSAL